MHSALDKEYYLRPPIFTAEKVRFTAATKCREYRMNKDLFLRSTNAGFEDNKDGDIIPDTRSDINERSLGGIGKH